MILEIISDETLEFGHPCSITHKFFVLLTDCKIVFQDKIALLSFNRDDVRNALTGTEIVNDIVKTALEACYRSK